MKEIPFETIGQVKETCVCGGEFTIKIRTNQAVFFAEGKCNKCGYAYGYWGGLAGSAEEKVKLMHKKACDEHKSRRRDANESTM